jgi:prepilin-type N-terminal cleavage/methylation domain-containing protein
MNQFRMPVRFAPRSRCCGFTLGELLVVVTVIALLAGMLIPTIGMVKDRAKRTNCLSNLHHIGAAFAAYAADNEQMVPMTQPSAISQANYYLQLNSVPMGLGLIATLNELPPKSLYCPANTKASHMLNDPSNPWTNLSYPIVDSQIRTSYALCWAEATGTATPASNYLVANKALMSDQCNCRYAMGFQHLTGSNVVLGDGSATYVAWASIQTIFNAIPYLYSANPSPNSAMSDYYTALASN